MTINEKIEAAILRASIEALQDRKERITKAMQNEEIAYWEYEAVSAQISMEMGILEAKLWELDTQDCRDMSPVNPDYAMQA